MRTFEVYIHKEKGYEAVKKGFHGLGFSSGPFGHS